LNWATLILGAHVATRGETMPSEHYESLYLCTMCRSVYYYEKTKDKFNGHCDNCGPTKMFKISAEELAGDEA